MTLANFISLVRIVSIPIFVIALLQGISPWPQVIYTLTMASDALDGFVARIKNQKTEVGAFLDPLGDKLLMFSAFLTLAYLGKLPLWMFVVIISRDVLILLGWIVIYFMTGSKEIKPRTLSKITTIFQMFSIWFFLMNFNKDFVFFVFYMTIAFTCLSGLDYIITGLQNLNTPKKKE